MERLSIYQTATEEKNKIETKFRKQTDEEKLFAKLGETKMSLYFGTAQTEYNKKGSNKNDFLENIILHQTFVGSIIL